MFTAFTCLACVVLGVQVVRLSRENARLKAAPSEAMEKAQGGALTVGEIVTPLTALGPTGPAPSGESNYLNVRDGRLATVVVAMGGACETCEASKPYFEALARDGAGGGVVFVGVELDTRTQGALRPGGGDLPIVMVERPETTWLRRVPLVPSVILVDMDGAVRRTWFGGLSERQRTELEAELVKARAGWKE